MGHFAYPNCKVASSLWFAHFGLRICGGAQLLGCFLDHPSIPLIFEVTIIDQRFFTRGKHEIFMCTPSFIVIICKIHSMLHTSFPPLANISSPMFQDPTNVSHFNPKTCDP